MNQKKMIEPINDHILIEPVKHETFIASDKATYEEIGIIKAISKTLSKLFQLDFIKEGDRVFFDSWMAAKYPTGIDNEYFWLVPYKDIRAIEKNGDKVSK